MLVCLFEQGQMEAIDKRIIINALDFIDRAALDLWDDRLSKERQLKFSTIELYEGIELLLKARLALEHWSLIIRDIDKFKHGSFKQGDFVSVNFETACERMESFCGEELNAPARQAFDGLRRLRNRYVHFSCDESRPLVMGIQLRAWHYVLKLLEEGFLGELTEKQAQQVDGIRELMLKSEEFLASRLEEVRAEVDSLRAERHLVLDCPDCQKLSLVLGDVGEGYPACLVCGTRGLSPEELAERYARSKNSFWRHPRHGPDDELAWCDECDRETVAPAGDETTAQIMQMLSSVPHEPGEDWELWLCIACGEPVIGHNIHHCGSCGTPYVSSATDHSCPQCRWY